VVKKLLFILLTVLFFASAVAYFIVVPVINAMKMPDEIRMSSDEYDSGVSLQSNRFVGQDTGEEAAVDGTAHKYIDLKLFGFIKIKRVKVETFPVEEVLVGGLPIGFVARMDGAMVVENASQHGLKKGDVIKSLNGKDVTSVKDFNAALGNLGKGKHNLDIVYKRDGEVRNTRTEFDNSGSKPLGLWLKDETTGVGTLTYINPNNNSFAALAHNVSDHETGVHIDLRDGDVYRTNILGITKSKGRNVGELCSTLRQGSSPKQGNVISSNDGGVFGCFLENSEILRESIVKYPVASRYSVKPGKAKLRTTLDSGPPREYDIEIVKTFHQTKRATKSMIIRITDKELLERTGGIVHGMSGSPIIQNGKIVGALTHVIVSDTTKGYGIYIDFVLP
jgi:stage IV sporulation protein B